MHIKKIELAWIVVDDFDKAVHFYTKTLGFTLNAHVPESGWAEVQGKDGGALLGIARSDKRNYIQPGNNAVLTMTVDDIVKSKEQLEKAGVIFLGEFIEIPGHVKMIFFKDLDNNLFQLVQSLDNKN